MAFEPGSGLKLDERRMVVLTSVDARWRQWIQQLASWDLHDEVALVEVPSILARKQLEELTAKHNRT